MAPHLDLLHLATVAASRAGAYLLRIERPRDPTGWIRKGRANFVTEIDRTAEQHIREVLLEGAPESTVVGEELSPDVATQGLVWIVDPLDGTTNFLHGVPGYAVSIAAAIDGVLEAGVVLELPSLRMFRASRGGGAWLGDQRLSVSTIADPADALIGTGFPFTDFDRLEEYIGQLRRVVEATSGIRRPGAAALDLAAVAAGAFDGFWEQRLSAWDIAAGIVLVREAGGRVTDFTGRDLEVEHASVVAGNPAIHRWLLDTVSGPDQANPAILRSGPT
jgi:myo-inositol-1(or 4)-monophosphatase